MKKHYIFTLIFLLLFSLIHSQTVTETENFDTAADGNVYSTASDSTPSGFWNGSADDNASVGGWQAQNGTTPTGYSSWNTGPSSANSGAYYAYTETSDPDGSASFILQSDTFNTSAGADDTSMSFYYHMNGSNVGTLYVEGSTDGGTTWDQSLWSKTGAVQSAESDAFIQVISGVNSFSPIPSTINKLRFRYVGGGGFQGDVAIDDIVVTYQTGR